MPGDGTGIDDLAVLLAFLERLGGRLDAPQRPLHIDAHDAVDFFRRDVEQGLHLRDAGIVDDDVEAAQFLLGKRHGGAHLIELRHVGNEGDGAAAQRAHFGGSRVQLVLVQIHQRDIGTILGQAQGDRLADTLRGTRDQRDFSGNTHLRSFQYREKSSKKPVRRSSARGQFRSVETLQPT